MISRRGVIQTLVAAAVCTTGGVIPAAFGARPIPWRNWSGSQLCYPAHRVAPASVEALREVISSTAGTVRPVGAGHSFTPLVPTDDTIISLSRLSGIVDADRASLQATLWAGTQLGDLGQPLEEAGQALINMPDIDEQILAGCLATATHGTGAFPASPAALLWAPGSRMVWEANPTTFLPTWCSRTQAAIRSTAFTIGQTVGCLLSFREPFSDRRNPGSSI